jgi:hypothetical protein
MPIQITSPCVLVVEGEEDKRFFEALLRYLQLEAQVIPVGGKTQLRYGLKALVQSPRFYTVARLGVSRDADSAPRAAFQSVCDALRTLGLPFPADPLHVVEGCPQVGVLILPGPDTPGTLEDLCLEAVAQDPAMDCVERYFQCLRQQAIPVADSKISKAKVHAFLASKPEPGRRLGEAAQAGYWPFDNKAFEQVKDFLKRLFG